MLSSYHDCAVPKAGPSHLIYFACGTRRCSFLCYREKRQEHVVVDRLASAAFAVVKGRAEECCSAVGGDSRWVRMCLI